MPMQEMVANLAAQMKPLFEARLKAAFPPHVSSDELDAWLWDNKAGIFEALKSHDGLVAALEQWKCPGCGGSGKYQQNATGRARKAEQGKPHDPRYEPDPVTCRVCNGDGLHPIASAALVRAGEPKGRFNAETWRRDATRRSPDMDVEDRIVAALVTDLLAHDPNWHIAVNDGEEICLKATRDPQAIMKALFSTDNDWLQIHPSKPAPKEAAWAWVLLIGGNGCDIVSDYTTNIPESVMARSNAIAEQYR